MARSTSGSLFRYPAVVVKWLDAHAKNQAVEYAESEVAQAHKAEPIITLGLLIKRDETGVSLYTEETGPDAIRGLSFIPAAMIEDVIPVTLTRKRSRKESPPCDASSSPPSS